MQRPAIQRQSHANENSAGERPNVHLGLVSGRALAPGARCKSLLIYTGGLRPSTQQFDVALRWRSIRFSRLSVGGRCPLAMLDQALFSHKFWRVPVWGHTVDCMGTNAAVATRILGTRLPLGEGAGLCELLRIDSPLSPPQPGAFGWP
jgi:hypothetical protein